MSFDWAKHIGGFHVDEDKLAIIPNPRTELGLHIMGKCIQASSLVGLALVGPLSAIYHGHRTRDQICNSAVDSARQGVIVGACLGPVVAGTTLFVKDKTQAYDFCYRIRFNHRAMRIDRFASLGAAGGTGMALYMGKDTLKGAALGLNGGVIFALLCNAVFG